MDRPIILNAAMVRAVLSGQKTQTRRPIKPQPPTECSIHYMLGAESWLSRDQQNPLSHYWEAWWGESFLNRPKGHLCGGHKVRSPFGQTGDRLWVRETWQHYQNSGQRAADFSEHQRFAANCFYRADESNPRTKPLSGKWRPSLLMPRWACRLVLPLVSVRVERVQDITEEDAKAEGVERISAGPGWECWMGYGPSSSCKTARDSFRSLWISIYGEASWDLNPWVWVAEWEEIEVRK